MLSEEKQERANAMEQEEGGGRRRRKYVPSGGVPSVAMQERGGRTGEGWRKSRMEETQKRTIEAGAGGGACQWSRRRKQKEEKQECANPSTRYSQQGRRSTQGIIHLHL